jgi:Regulator of ribonuclease activity B
MTKLERLRELLPWKRKGYKILGKYDSSDPREGDLQTLAQLLAHGADLTKERHVIHYLYFTTDEARAKGEEQLQARGYKTRHGVDYGDVRPKSLIAERHGLANEATIDEERTFLTGIAETDGGDYDGWEAALD